MERPCTVCDSQSHHNKIFVKKGVDYLRCGNCGLIIVDPIPSLDEVKRYYDKDYQRDEGMGTARSEAEFLFHATASSRIPLIKAHRDNGRWLDIGCANGAFLEVIAASGYEAYGIDLSESAVEMACRKGLNARASTIEDCSDDPPYDVVSAFDVIEHVLDPSSFLHAAHGLLNAGGVLALTTPDTESIMARLMGSRWYEYIPETHFFNFDRTNLSTLLDRHGFDAIKTTRAKKHLNFLYGQIQFQAYNPLIHRSLSVLGLVLPRRIKELPISTYIGEMLIIAKKTAD